MKTNECFSSEREKPSVSEQKSDRKRSKLTDLSCMWMHVYGLFICEHLSSIVARPAAASGLI